MPETMQTIISGADLSASQFQCVQLSAANVVTQAVKEDGSQVLIGAVQNKPASGAAADVPKVGEVGLVTCGAKTDNVNILPGDFLTASTGGLAIKADKDQEMTFGIALQPSAKTADNDVIRYLATGTALLGKAPA